MAKSVVLVTGAGGFLGSLLANALLQEFNTANVHLILVDIFEPQAPSSATAITIKADLTDKTQIDALFTTEFGIPDTIYCLHGIMSRGSEDNFDLGLRVNVDAVRLVLEAARHHGESTNRPLKFIFASSLAVYGGALPFIVTPETIATPESAYGMEKLVSELFVNEYTRRGFVDGRILRLPTVVVRPGAPSAATSSFMSGVIREPLKGIESTCPIGNSLDSPELDLAAWVASPETTIKNFLIAKQVDASKFMPHTRVICLPGFTMTVREELEALEKVGGKEALKLVKFKDDPTNRRVVSSWPARFDNSYPLSLGFVVDEGGMVALVEQFKAKIALGVV